MFVVLCTGSDNRVRLWYVSSVARVEKRRLTHYNYDDDNDDWWWRICTIWYQSSVLGPSMYACLPAEWRNFKSWVIARSVSPEFALGGQLEDLWDGRPPAGSRGRAPLGVWGLEAEDKICMRTSLMEHSKLQICNKQNMMFLCNFSLLFPVYWTIKNSPMMTCTYVPLASGYAPGTDCTSLQQQITQNCYICWQWHLRH